MSDLVKRLEEIVGDDHLRGCGGRQYSCGNTYEKGVVCDYDKRKDALCLEAAAEITRLTAALATARDETIEEAAILIETHQEGTSNVDGMERHLTPRRAGDQLGLAFATAIRAIKEKKHEGR